MTIFASGYTKKKKGKRNKENGVGGAPAPSLAGTKNILEKKEKKWQT